MPTSPTDTNTDTGTWEEIKRRAREGKILVVTGAGISAESGIPTFRGKDGYWTIGSTEYSPQEIATTTTLESHADELWDWYLDRLRSYILKASPNPAHQAIVELEKFAGDRMLLVTQNIDGLHLDAGSSNERTIEIHGDARRMRCSDECWIRNNNEIPEFWDIEEGASFPEDFTCPRCSYLTRPHVLLFDEVYSQELYRSREASSFATEADLTISIGCSAGVHIAQTLCNLAVVNDAMHIDLNTDEGPMSNLALQTGLFLAGKAGRTVPDLVEILTHP
jgi:NAD-dependent deacetylase